MTPSGDDTADTGPVNNTSEPVSVPIVETSNADNAQVTASGDTANVPTTTMSAPPASPKDVASASLDKLNAGVDVVKEADRDPTAGISNNGTPALIGNSNVTQQAWPSTPSTTDSAMQSQQSQQQAIVSNPHNLRSASVGGLPSQNPPGVSHQSQPSDTQSQPTVSHYGYHQAHHHLYHTPQHHPYQQPGSHYQVQHASQLPLQGDMPASHAPNHGPQRHGYNLSGMTYGPNHPYTHHQSHHTGAYHSPAAQDWHPSANGGNMSMLNNAYPITANGPAGAVGADMVTGGYAANYSDQRMMLNAPPGSHLFTSSYDEASRPGMPYLNPFEVKHRRRTTKSQFRVLEDTFLKTPRPSAEVRKAISDNLEMPPRAVQIWFQNRRAKAKAAAKKALAAAAADKNRRLTLLHHQQMQQRQQQQMQQQQQQSMHMSQASSSSEHHGDSTTGDMTSDLVGSNVEAMTWTRSGATRWTQEATSQPHRQQHLQEDPQSGRLHHSGYQNSSPSVSSWRNQAMNAEGLAFGSSSDAPSGDSTRASHSRLVPSNMSGGSSSSLFYPSHSMDNGLSSPTPKGSRQVASKTYLLEQQQQQQVQPAAPKTPSSSKYDTEDNQLFVDESDARRRKLSA